MQSKLLTTGIALLAIGASFSFVSLSVGGSVGVGPITIGQVSSVVPAGIIIGGPLAFIGLIVLLFGLLTHPHTTDQVEGTHLVAASPYTAPVPVAAASPPRTAPSTAGAEGKKYCMTCGEAIPDRSIFCPKCGNRQ